MDRDKNMGCDMSASRIDGGIGGLCEIEFAPSTSLYAHGRPMQSKDGGGRAATHLEAPRRLAQP